MIVKSTESSSPMDRSEHELDYEAYMEWLSGQGDAGHVILSAAIADDWLEILLLSQMRKALPGKVAKRLFSGTAGALRDPQCLRVTAAMRNRFLMSVSVAP
jgi:hypothetical protein